MDSLGGKAVVVEIEPARAAADVEGRRHGIELIVRAGARGRPAALVVPGTTGPSSRLQAGSWSASMAQPSVSKQTVRGRAVSGVAKDGRAGHVVGELK